uniref:SUEL-type lectin domain-containing protein n=1 Tax=Salarias fasciatus TaxID=181472 RepID=A0A672HAY8_SALFA
MSGLFMLTHEGGQNQMLEEPVLFQGQTDGMVSPLRHQQSASIAAGCQVTTIFCDFSERQKKNKDDRKKRVTCEGKTAKLRCGKILLVLLCPQHFKPLVSPVVVISVVKANYGRLDGKKCSRGRSRAQLTCLLPPVFTPHISIHRCNGKRRCNLRASNSVFGDPCRGTYKYLEVDFVCKSE